MIAATLLVAVLATPAPNATPSPAPGMPLIARTAQAAPSATASIVPGLPPIERGLALPYPAYGSPQPQIILTRPAANIPAIVSLDAATAIAIDRVPALAAARAEVALEDAAVQLTKTGLAPDVSIAGATKTSYTQGVTDAGAQTAGGTISGVGQSNTADISLSQLIFDGGQIRAKIDAARLSRDATLAVYRRDAQTVAGRRCGGVLFRASRRAYGRGRR
jgi:hypothetical protein